MKLEDIEKMCERATPAPWTTCKPDSDDLITGKDDFSVAGCCCCGGFDRVEDAAFVAASRELVPKLLAVAKAAERFARYARYHVIENDEPHILGWEETMQALEELERQEE